MTMMNPQRTWADSYVLYVAQGRDYDEMVVDTANTEEVIGKRFLYDWDGHLFEARCSENFIGQYKVVGRAVAFCYIEKDDLEEYEN